MNEKRCVTCRYYLGGGCCRINSEKECGDNEFELWELRDNANNGGIKNG